MARRSALLFCTYVLAALVQLPNVAAQCKHPDVKVAFDPATQHCQVLEYPVPEPYQRLTPNTTSAFVQRHSFDLPELCTDAALQPAIQISFAIDGVPPVRPEQGSGLGDDLIVGFSVFNASTGEQRTSMQASLIHSEPMQICGTAAAACSPEDAAEADVAVAGAADCRQVTIPLIGEVQSLCSLVADGDWVSIAIAGYVTTEQRAITILRATLLFLEATPQGYSCSVVPAAQPGTTAAASVGSSRVETEVSVGLEQIQRPCFPFCGSSPSATTTASAGLPSGEEIEATVDTQVQQELDAAGVRAASSDPASLDSLAQPCWPLCGSKLGQDEGAGIAAADAHTATAGEEDDQSQGCWPTCSLEQLFGELGFGSPSDPCFPFCSSSSSSSGSSAATQGRKLLHR